MYRNAIHWCFFTVDPKARAKSTKGTLNKNRIPKKLKITWTKAICKLFRLFLCNAVKIPDGVVPKLDPRINSYARAGGIKSIPYRITTSEVKVELEEVDKNVANAPNVMTQNLKSKCRKYYVFQKCKILVFTVCIVFAEVYFTLNMLIWLVLKANGSKVPCILIEPIFSRQMSTFQLIVKESKMWWIIESIQALNQTFGF